QNEKPNGHQVVQNEELTSQVVQVVQNKGPNDQVFQNEDNDEINRISVSIGENINSKLRTLIVIISSS
ncbi:17033_t:CDS:2, partial [Dentiscutata erythropus]